MKTMILIWKVLRPDIRQYKQQSIEVETDTPVVVEVPDEMVANTVACDPNLANGVDENGNAVLHTLTLAGVRYVQQQFEGLFEDAVEASGWDSSLTDRKDVDDWDSPESSLKNTFEAGWDDDLATNERKGDPEPTSPDDWGSDNGVFSDDTGNAPDAEIWNEKDEDWNA